MTQSKKNILFVCRGNILRSPVAEQLLKMIIAKKGLSEEISVSSRGLQGSAGTKPPEHKTLPEYKEIWKSAKDTLSAFGINLQDHAATPIVLADAEQASIIIALDQNVLAGEPKAVLVAQFPQLKSKMRLFRELSNGQDIIDPFENSETTPEEIEKISIALEQGFETLLRWLDNL